MKTCFASEAQPEQWLGQMTRAYGWLHFTFKALLQTKCDSRTSDDWNPDVPNYKKWKWKIKQASYIGMNVTFSYFPIILSPASFSQANWEIRVS